MGYVIVSALSLLAGFSLAAATLRPRGPSRRRGGYLPPSVFTEAKAPGRPTPATGTTAASSSQPAPGVQSEDGAWHLTLAQPNNAGGPTVYGNATGGNPGLRLAERAGSDE